MKYEYKKIDIRYDSELESTLNSLGVLGWKVIAVEGMCNDEKATRILLIRDAGGFEVEKGNDSECWTPAKLNLETN